MLMDSLVTSAVAPLQLSVKKHRKRDPWGWAARECRRGPPSHCRGCYKGTILLQEHTPSHGRVAKPKCSEA